MNNINFPTKTLLQSELSKQAYYPNDKYFHSAFRLPRLSLVFVVMAMAIFTAGFQNACADTPPLALILNGPEHAQAGAPMDSIEVRLVNPGKEAADARLRLFIHDKEDREVQTGDIKIDIRGQQGWRALSVEDIDGGVMAAIGAADEKDNENHEKGGFPISKKATQVWQIRLIFNLPGQYTLVVAVSPDNGASHLAKPASLKIKVL